MGGLSDTALKELLESPEVKAAGFTRVVAFRPTGWSFRCQETSRRGSGGGQQLTLRPPKPRPPSSETLAEGVGGSAKAVRGAEAARVVSLPYSEHSSVEELREMVRILRPVRVMPTVAKSSEHRTEILRLLQAAPGKGGGQEGW